MRQSKSDQVTTEKGIKGCINHCGLSPFIESIILAPEITLDVQSNNRFLFVEIDFSTDRSGLRIGKTPIDLGQDRRVKHKEPQGCIQKMDSLETFTTIRS